MTDKSVKKEIDALNSKIQKIKSDLNDITRESRSAGLFFQALIFFRFFFPCAGLCGVGAAGWCGGGANGVAAMRCDAACGSAAAATLVWRTTKSTKKKKNDFFLFLARIFFFPPLRVQ